jgi:hypothetical protein
VCIIVKLLIYFYCRRIAAYDNALPASDAMSPSPSTQSTPSRDLSSPGAQSSDGSYGNLFRLDSGSDQSYSVPPNARVSPTDTSGIDLIRRVRSALEQWVSALGPIEDWPRIFREKYDEACVDTAARTTQDAIDIFLGEVGEHVWIGKDIIAGLERCAVLTLPQPQGGEADRLLVGDMM